MGLAREVALSSPSQPSFLLQLERVQCVLQVRRGRRWRAVEEREEVERRRRGGGC